MTVARTGCCVVGGGPAGVVLALLLARSGVETLLLEEHRDFHRDFRGDTLHPPAMELMDQLGLTERLLELRHSKVRTVTIETDEGQLRVADFGSLRTRHPYITLLPQADFLEFLAHEAARYPAFRLVMGASVQRLIVEQGVVRGVRYRARDGWHEVRALLTVAADGRFSRIRHLAGLEPISTSPPMDVLWSRVSRREGDPEGAQGRFRGGRAAVALDRGDLWQIGFVFPKGGYQQLRADGLPALREALSKLLPELGDRFGELQSWQQVSLLSVESSRLRRWYQPGLLLIGDAAHVMSPVGGVGINYAILDAVATANLLSGPLRSGRLSLRDLAAVQRRRELPTRAIQALQTIIQQRVLSPALHEGAAPRVPWPVVRLAPIRWLLARFIAYGLWTERLEAG